MIIIPHCTSHANGTPAGVARNKIWHVYHARCESWALPARCGPGRAGWEQGVTRWPRGPAMTQRRGLSVCGHQHAFVDVLPACLTRPPPRRTVQPCTLVTSPAAWSAQQPSTPSYPRHPSARTPLDTSRPSSPRPRPATLGTHMHYTHTYTQSQTGRQSGVGHIDTHPHAHLLPTHTLTFCQSSNRCSFMPPLPFARGVPKFRSRARPAGTGPEQGPRAGAGRHSGRRNVLLYARETERWMQEWIRLPGRYPRQSLEGPPTSVLLQVVYMQDL